MTTPASEPARKVGSPATVLRQIENSDGVKTRSDVALRNSDPNAPMLRVVHADQEVFDDHLDQPLELPQQIIELTSHLKRRRDDLVAREQKLNDKIASWQTNMDARGAATSDHERRLGLREQKLRSLQFHLLQMQNDLIDSQLAMENVIEHFEDSESDSDGFMKLALELLRFEVLDRFDYISERWETLHGKLENLYSEQQLRKAG